MVSENVDIPTLLSQEHEVGNRRLRSGKQNEDCIRRYRLPRLDQADRNSRLHAQRVEIVEIGDPRQMRNSNDDTPRSLLAAQTEDILRRQVARLVEPWNDAQTRPAGS